MEASNLFQKACLIQLSTSCWTGSRNLNPSFMERVGDSDWLKGKKLLINPELLGTIKTSIQKARMFISKSALPFPMSGLYLIPKEAIQDVDAHLDFIKAEFEDKVEQFLTLYDDAKDEAKAILGGLHNEADYPHDIRSKFRFDWRFLLLDVPDKASILPPEIYLREKEKFIDLMAETKEMAMSALREEFAGIVHHLVDRVSGEEDGKPRSLKSSMLNRINEFILSFGDRNLFDDHKLQALVEEAKTVVSDIRRSGYSLQYNEVMRRKIGSDAQRLKDAVDQAVEELPRRKLRLETFEALAA